MNIFRTKQSPTQAHHGIHALAVSDSQSVSLSHLHRLPRRRLLRSQRQLLRRPLHLQQRRRLVARILPAISSIPSSRPSSPDGRLTSSRITSPLVLHGPLPPIQMPTARLTHFLLMQRRLISRTIGLSRPRKT